MYRAFLSAAICAGMLAASGPSSAAVVTGNLNLTGAVEFSSSSIDFTPRFGGSGRATVVDGSSDTFATLISTTAFIKDVSLSPPPSGILDAITFQVAPQLHFDALSAGPGIFSSAACTAPRAIGQTCTLPGTPFNLTNTSQGSTLSVDIGGSFKDLSDGNSTPTPYSGLFTAQFIGKSYQQVLADIAGGATVTTSYSASFAPAVIPEPSMVLMVGAGLLLLVGLRRKIV